MNDYFNFDDVPVLGFESGQRLLRALEFALPIQSAGQLFTWSQSHLQALVAYESLLCGFGDANRGDMRVFKLCAAPPTDRHAAGAGDPLALLMSRAIECWVENACRPLVIMPDSRLPGRAEVVRGLLHRCGLENLVMHGARSVDARTGAFCLFGGVTSPFGRNQIHVVELIMPYLRHVIERVVVLERAKPAAATLDPVRPRRLPTQREIDILRWVQMGKSSPEIASILSISPSTVKNHVQTILKKLNAQSRAQAVSRAIALGLLT